MNTSPIETSIRPFLSPHRWRQRPSHKKNLAPSAQAITSILQSIIGLPLEYIQCLKSIYSLKKSIIGNTPESKWSVGAVLLKFFNSMDVHRQSRVDKQEFGQTASRAAHRQYLLILSFHGIGFNK